MTRRSIAERTALAEATVSRLTRDLLEARLIVSAASRMRGAEGRPPDVLELNHGGAYAIGIAVDGVYQKAVVCDLGGNVLSSHVEPSTTALPAEPLVASLGALAERAVADAGVAPENVLGLGVNLQAIVDRQAGTAFAYPATPGWSSVWDDLPLRDLLERRLPWRPVVVEDTVRALGTAESQLGGRELNEDFVFVIADTGIGASLVMDGKSYIGPSGVVGELGHVPVPGCAIPCCCGSVGCVTEVASAIAVRRELRRRMAEVEVLTRLEGAGDGDVEIASVLQAADSGDKLAYQVVTEAGYHLGQAISVLLNLLGFRLIVMGGSLAASTAYVDSVLHALRLCALPQVSRQLRIETSRLGALADARSAANLIIDESLSDGGARLLGAVGRSDAGPAESMAGI